MKLRVRFSTPFGRLQLLLLRLEVRYMTLQAGDPSRVVSIGDVADLLKEFGEWQPACLQ